MTFYISMFFAGVFFSGFFSMLEAAVISQDKHRLRHLADAGDGRAATMQRLLEQPDRLLSTLLLCNNLANVSCATAAAALVNLAVPDSDAGLLWVTFGVTFVLLVFSEITPKVIGVRHALPIALALARPLAVLQRALTPLTAIANFCANLLLVIARVKKDGPWQDAMTMRELRSVVRSAARAEGDREQLQMVDKTLRLNELTVEKIMTPRHEIVAVDLRDDESAIVRIIESAEHGKLPVIDGTWESPVGVLDTLRAVKLLREGRGASAAALRKMCEEVDYVPAALTALQQLQNMRRRRLSLVVDGSGRVTGMLTFTDFAHAIIGEERREFARADDGGWLLRGDDTLLELEQLQPGAHAPDDIDASTVNGMILERLGDVPEREVCLRIGDWRLEVTKMDDKAILQVILKEQPVADS